MSQHLGISLVALLAALPHITDPALQPSQQPVLPGWPVLKQRHEQFAFVAPETAGVDQPFVLHLQDVSGTEKYRLECHVGGQGQEDLLKWSGLYQCALFPTNGDSITAVDLLAADTRQEQADDGWNRGRILAQQFHAPCVSYPEYSTLRHFKLRGFDLTLAFTDVVWSGPRIGKFTLHVDVTPDAEANSDVALTAAGDRPPRACYPGPKAAE
ncbi:MAG TPA: hypothetical protein VGM16_06945, partial [Gammaproteobacteria bacterium]